MDGVVRPHQTHAGWRQYSESTAKCRTVSQDPQRQMRYDSCMSCAMCMDEHHTAIYPHYRDVSVMDEAKLPVQPIIIKKHLT